MHAHPVSHAYASELHLRRKVQVQPAEGLHTCFPAFASSLEAVTLMPEFYAEY